LLEQTHEFKHNREVFDAKARQWTRQFAGQGAAAEPAATGTSAAQPPPPPPRQQQQQQDEPREAPLSPARPPEAQSLKPIAARSPGEVAGAPPDKENAASTAAAMLPPPKRSKLSLR
jgi:hypothetical protein